MTPHKSDYDFHYLKNMCCRALHDMHSHDLSSKFILGNFISRLKDNIKPFVKGFSPQTIPQAITYARLQEEALKSSQTKPYKPQSY